MILILGFFLVLIWGSLRFSDAQRINLRSLVYNGENLRGLSWRTKTTNRGQAFGVLAQGLLSQKSFHWMHRYLLTLDAVLDRVGTDYIDYLMPDVVDQTGVALPIRPMSYATAMKWLRYCIRVPWKQQTGSRLDPSVFTIHSCKATVLSWSAQQAHLLTEESRLQQGHHRIGSKGSLRLYSRDDVHPALRLQGILRESILQGWRPTVPQHRGSQSALVEPTVGVIEQYSKNGSDEFQVVSFWCTTRTDHLITTAADRHTREESESSSSSDSSASSSSSDKEKKKSTKTAARAPATYAQLCCGVTHFGVGHAMVPDDSTQESSLIWQDLPWKTACGRRLSKATEMMDVSQCNQVHAFCNNPGCRRAWNSLHKDWDVWTGKISAAIPVGFFCCSKTKKQTRDFFVWDCIHIRMHHCFHGVRWLFHLGVDTVQIQTCPSFHIREMYWSIWIHGVICMLVDQTQGTEVIASFTFSSFPEWYSILMILLRNTPVLEPLFPINLLPQLFQTRIRTLPFRSPCFLLTHCHNCSRHVYEHSRFGALVLSLSSFTCFRCFPTRQFCVHKFHLELCIALAYRTHGGSGSSRFLKGAGRPLRSVWGGSLHHIKHHVRRMVPSHFCVGSDLTRCVWSFTVWLVKHQLFNKLDCVFVGVKPTPSWLLLQHPLRPHRPFLHQIHPGTRPSPRSWAQSWSNEWRKISSVSILVKSSIKTPCQVSDSSASSMTSFPRKTGTGCLGNIDYLSRRTRRLRVRGWANFQKLRGCHSTIYWWMNLLVWRSPILAWASMAFVPSWSCNLNFGISPIARVRTLETYEHLVTNFCPSWQFDLTVTWAFVCPNVLEAQSADKAIWGSISDLLNGQNWSLDECLCEFTNVRSDLATLLQPRPKITKPPVVPPTWRPNDKGGKGKGNEKGGRGKSSKGWQRQANLDIGIPTQWGVEADLHEVPIQQLSARQLSLCTRLRISRSDNTACAGKPSAFDHQSTGHWLAPPPLEQVSTMTVSHAESPNGDLDTTKEFFAWGCANRWGPHWIQSWRMFLVRITNCICHNLSIHSIILITKLRYLDVSFWIFVLEHLVPWVQQL